MFPNQKRWSPLVRASFLVWTSDIASLRRPRRSRAYLAARSNYVLRKLLFYMSFASPFRLSTSSETPILMAKNFLSLSWGRSPSNWEVWTLRRAQNTMRQCCTCTSFCRRLITCFRWRNWGDRPERWQGLTLTNGITRTSSMPNASSPQCIIINCSNIPLFNNKNLTD